MEVEKPRMQFAFDLFPDTVAVIGSRSFEDTPVVDKAMQEMVRRFVRKLPQETEIVSGGARGVDTYAARAAKKHKRKLHVEWPNKDIPIPRRFLERNEALVEYVAERAGLVAAFVDQDNMRGTMHAIRYAKKLQVPHIIFSFTRLPLRMTDIEVVGCEYLVMGDTSPTS